MKHNKITARFENETFNMIKNSEEYLKLDLLARQALGDRIEGLVNTLTHDLDWYQLMI